MLNNALGVSLLAVSWVCSKVGWLEGMVMVCKSHSSDVRWSHPKKVIDYRECPCFFRMCFGCNIISFEWSNVRDGRCRVQGTWIITDLSSNSFEIVGLLKINGLAQPQIGLIPALMLYLLSCFLNRALACFVTFVKRVMLYTWNYFRSPNEEDIRHIRLFSRCCDALLVFNIIFSFISQQVHVVSCRMRLHFAVGLPFLPIIQSQSATCRCWNAAKVYEGSLKWMAALCSFKY